MRGLLEDDKFLLQQTRKHLEHGQQRLRDIFQAITVIHLGLRQLKLFKRTGIGELAIHALSGELQNSSIVENLLTTLRTLDSESLKDLLAALPKTPTEDPVFQAIQGELGALLEMYDGEEPLRSEYDNRHSIVKTTVVQQRVKLSKGKTKLPKQNIEYTKIVDRLHTAAETYLNLTLIKPQDMFLHEVFLYDLKNPVKDAFTSRSRFAIERALSSPFDYLISTAETGRLSTKQPATAILYQLYLESGALVNVYDLWHAFHAVFESAEGNDCDDRLTMALFYRALSELRALGIVKSSRRKADHIAKSAWVGL